MKDIHVNSITEAVAAMAVQACCKLPADVRKSFEAALTREPSPVGRNILDQLLENAAIAAEEDIPICQDTGLAVVFADLGQDVHIVGGGFEDAV
ncbi:fumarate hydratase, partial [uncultured Desulfovibrio sp.]